jgi:hypothetical protein
LGAIDFLYGGEQTARYDMTFIGNRTAIGALVMLLGVGVHRSSAAQTADTSVVMTVETIQLYRAKEPTPIPAARPESKSKSPGGKAVWIPGFWDLKGNRNSAPRAGWTWVPGRWVTAPEHGARWEPAHWGMADEWWSWIPGHWVVPGHYGYPPDLPNAKIARLKESQEDQD